MHRSTGEPRRPWRDHTVRRLVAVAVLVAALAGCSGSGPDDATAVTSAPGATTSGTTQGDLDRSCNGVAALLYRSVTAGAADPSIAADRPATAGLVPEQITKFLRDLAPVATGGARDDLAIAVGGAEAFAAHGTQFSAEVQAALDRLVVWAATQSPCPPSTPVWACLDPTSGPAPDPGATGSATAEEAGEALAPVDPEGERTTVADGPDVAASAWVDGHLLVRERVTVARAADGWHLAKRTSCPHAAPGAGSG